MTITGQAQQGGGGDGTGTPDVFNERASDARINLEYLLRIAARTAHPTRRTTTPAEHAAVAVARVQEIARSPGAHTTAQDLRDALHEADKVRDRAEEKFSYGPCSCGVELITPKSRDQARCRECGEVWDVHQLRAFRHVAALDAAHDHRGKLAEVVKVLNLAGHTLKLNTVCKWVERGKLRPDDDGLFTGRSVAELSRT
ncbi:hypothetical protein ACFYE2_00545 [Kocuria sp. CPCC 205300]|uniref:hypothetical protein n=1 Tax=Kocuria sabuli TaxID=3071448 RepID=UPI0036DCEAA1